MSLAGCGRALKWAQLALGGRSYSVPVALRPLAGHHHHSHAAVKVAPLDGTLAALAPLKAAGVCPLVRRRSRSRQANKSAHFSSAIAAAPFPAGPLAGGRALPLSLFTPCPLSRRPHSLATLVRR